MKGFVRNTFLSRNPNHYHTKPSKLECKKLCMVLGKVGVGKSTTLNHIISGSPYPHEWKQPFKTSDSVNSVTQCSDVSVHNDILYFDTPGFADPRKVDEVTIGQLKGIFNMMAKKNVPSIMMVVVKGSRLSEDDQQVLSLIFENFTGDPSSIILVVTHVDPEETVDSCRKRFSELKENDKLKKMLLDCCTIAVMEQQKSPMFAEELKEVRIDQLKWINSLIEDSKANARPTLKTFDTFLEFLSMLFQRFCNKCIYGKGTVDALSKIVKERKDVNVLFGECSICLDGITMKNAARFHCGHIACKVCAAGIICNQRIPKCPICTKPLVKLIQTTPGKS